MKMKSAMVGRGGGMDSRPVSWYGMTFFRGNDELKVVSVIFVPMTDNVNI